MADKLPWFRFYTEAIADRKLRRLDPAGRLPPDLLRRTDDRP